MGKADRAFAKMKNKMAGSFGVEAALRKKRLDLDPHGHPWIFLPQLPYYK